MGAASDDNTDSELKKYAPKWSDEQSATPNDAERTQYVSTSASIYHSFKDEFEDRRIRSLRSEPVPEPPAQENVLLAQMGRMALVAGVAAVVALLVVYAKPLLEGASSLNSTSQNSKSPSYLTG